MKKAKTIGKKTLSVFLAVLMVLTAWVWVAPTEASAVSAGKYYVRVSYDCADKYDNGSAYTGPDFTDVGAGYTIYYAANNGTGTETYSSSTVINLTEECKSNFTTKTKVTEVPGFPTSVHYYNKGGTIWSRTYGITKVEVASTSSGTWTTLWEGDVEADAASTQWKAKIDKDGATKVNTGTGGWVTFSTTTKNWVYPKANSIVWNTAETSNITLSSTGTSSYTRNFKYVIKDKYGVIMGDTALSNLNTKVSYSLTSTNFPTLNNNGDIKANTDSGYDSNLYHTYTNGTSEYHVAVNVNDQLRSLVDGLNERTVTLKVTCGTLSSTKTFKINDSKHTITFNKNANDASNMIPNSYSVYYGESLASQATIDSASTYPTAGSRTGYTFLGMYDAAEGGNLMNINEEVTTGKTYYAHWEILKYAAVFLDRSGDNVVLVESDIEHGSAATKADEAMSKLNTIEYDDVNHYVLNESDVWTPSTDSVTGNTFFYPNYTATPHTLDSGNAIEANCQHGAGIEYKCTGCDYSYIEETSTTLGEHTKSDSYIVDTEATCTVAGSGHYFCTVCGDTVETVEIPAKGHSYKAEVTKSATCDEVGNKKYTCTVCDYYYDEEIPLTQHNYVAGETVAATCQHSPYTPYTCEGCGDSYNKYEGNATNNHNWNITVSDVTASNTKVVTGACSVCSATFEKEVELPATHNFTNIAITKQPTCIAEGEITISCADTGCTESYTATLPAVSTAHSEYTTTYTPATCGAKGSVVTKCKDCGVTIKETEIAALNHSYNYVRVEPTCTTAGSVTKTCANCGDVKTETISATGHKTVTVEANCQHGGYEKCGVCGDVISTTKKTDHDFSGTVTEVAATCTADGIKLTKCKNCDAQNAETLGKTGHDVPADFTVVVPATCLGQGIKTKTCSECKVIIESEIISATGHNYEAYAEGSYAATCTTAGVSAEKCSLCGDVNKDVIQPLTHNYKSEVIAPTCTSKGYTKKTCQRDNCGEVVYTNETPALNHAWTSTTHAADCTHSAYIEHVCGNDSSHNYVEYVSGSNALLHDFTGTETIVKAANCTEDGSKTVKCKNCQETTTVVIPRLGHNYGAWVVEKEATNTEDGQWKRVCANNAEHIEYITIPKGGHTWDNGTVTKAATCKETGTMLYKCNAHANCGITLEVTVPVTQHTIAQKVTDATCTSTGTVEAYCSTCDVNCEKPFSTKELPVVPHTLDEGTAVAPTCTTSGYTTYACACGTFSYNEYDDSKPATGHTYVGEITTPAGCTTEGLKTFTCDCGDSYTEEIPATGHTYDAGTVVQNQSCTNVEKTEYKCACGDSYTVITKEAKGHTYTNWEVITPATADKYGVQKGTCTCGDIKYDVLVPIGNHIFTEEVTKAATCTTAGEKTYTCSVHTNCSANYTEEIPATGHTQKITYTAPTCIAEGTSKIVCSVESCKAEIMSTSIPATGIHNFDVTGVKVDATCTATGTMTYTCATDGCTAKKIETIPAKGHTFTTTVTDAKCGEKGSVVTECKVCNDPTVKTVTELAAKGHIWKDNPESTVDAKCDTDGSETYKCQNCDETNVVVLPKLGHNWSDWTVIPSTNNDKGSVSRTCSVCNEVEKVDIPAGGHILTETARTNSTCVTPGSVTYTCQVAHVNGACGISVTVELPLAEHTIVTTEKPATCTEPGFIKKYCTVEGCTHVVVDEVRNKLAHVYVAGTAVAPTCTTSGYTPYTCSCGDTYNKYDEDKPANGHTLVEGASTANCTAGGQMTITCSKCNNYSTTVDVPALGHNYVENAAKATEATCASAATKTYECSRCADSYTISVGEKSAEHTWGAWQVKESATASSLGYEIRTCNVCGKMEVRTIAATGEHNFSTETGRKDATCTEKGWIDYKCSTHTDCGKTSRVELPALGHTKTIEYKAASCTETGYTKIVCSVEGCDYEANKTEIPALGHLYGEGTVTNATCKDTGKIEYTCTRTGCTATHETVIATNSNAHQYVTVVTGSTCTVKGSVVTKCALCGNVTTNKELPVIEHSWNSGEVKEGDAATCTTYGTKTFTCTVCSATKTETIAKLGHDWGAWSVTKASTNTEKGTLTRECTRGCTETAEIPAGGHNLVVDIGNSTAATCTKEGSVTYICDTEHTGGVDCGITVTVTLDKIQHEFETTKTDATCEGTGSVITKCKNCDTATITTTIPATGHTYNDGVKTDATCTSEGKIVYTCTAKDCSKTKEVILDMLQHVYEPGEAVEPTCTSSGYTPYKCKTCDSSYVILGEAAKGHNYEKVVSSTATCGKAGKITLECTECADTMTTDVPALGHDYQLNSTTTATCAAAATETYKCTRCSSNYTVSVGSKTENHDWNDWVTVEKADYDSIGYKTRTCKICDKLEVETIPATGSHNFVEDHRDNATCTADGKIYYTCDTHDDCGVTDEIVIPKLGHDEELRYTAATCTKKGSTSIYCDVCKTTLDSEEIPALEHVWGSEEITQPTCSSKGSIKFTCTSCNTETKTVEIPVNTDAHKLTTSTEKAATCKEEGLLVTTCALCDYRTVTPLPMLQHSWGDWVKVDATNDTDGSWTRTCSNGCTETVVIPKGGHNLVEDAAAYRAPTCTDKGERVYKCTNHTNCSVKVTVTLEKVQHALVTESETATCEKGGFVKVYCSNCDYKPVDMTIGKLAHNDEIIETVPATCETAGYTTFECQVCKRGFSRLDAQPTGHKYVKDGAIVTAPATCETAGYTTYNCDNCDETHVVDIAAAKGHSWTEWTVEKAATNTEKGLLSRTCINGCGEKETAEIPAGGHTFDTKNPVSTTQGTCETKGTKTFKCTAHTNCGIEITVETEFGSHAWSDWTKVDATNDEDGYWTRKCATCEEEETLVIPAGNHNLVEDTTKYVEPKCDAKGQRVYKCDAHENCSVTITVVLERVQHTAGVDKKDATCTENGYVKTYCTACGELISEKELPLIAHNYDANGDGKVDKKDAVFEDGTYTYTCQAGCGHTITEDADDVYKVRFFDAAGNQIGETQNVKFGESAVAPAAPEKKADGTYHYEFSSWDRNYGKITSDLDVYPTYEKELHYGGEATCKDKALCDKCGTPYGETDDSKHVIATKIESATCEESGTITYYCSEGCGKATTVEEIKPMGHDFGEWEIYQAGNCAAPTIKIRKCRNYGCDKHERWEIVNSHNWHIVKEIPPTCTAVGYSEYKYCLSCGTAVDSVKIPALGHRDNNGDGRCDYCTYVQNEVKCNCMCHSTGFMKFIYSIVRFFWRLTKSTPSCSCGARHY